MFLSLGKKVDVKVDYRAVWIRGIGRVVLVEKVCESGWKSEGEGDERKGMERDGGERRQCCAVVVCVSGCCIAGL
jgi:hypothetical protein